MQGLLRRLGVRSPSQAARALSSSSSASVQYASKRVLRETVGSSADWNHFAMRNKLPGTVNLGQGFCDFVPDQVSRLLQVRQHTSPDNIMQRPDGALKLLSSEMAQ